MSGVSNLLVHLCCEQCNSQIGTFENEWIRLTSSYARAKSNGRHIGTEIGNRIRDVPAGVTQKAAEGCGMAEVFCRECSNRVGQYCKSAPTPDKQSLVNNYFYKLSRTYLADPQTSHRIEHVFGYEGDLVMPPPKFRPSMRRSVRPSARPSMSIDRYARPSLPFSPRDSLSTFSEIGTGFRRSMDRNSFAEMRADSLVSERLSNLERRVTGHEFEDFLQSRTMMSMTEYGHRSLNGSQERSFSQQTTEQDSVIEDQRKQITSLTTQIEKLNDTIQNMSSVLHELRSERQAKAPPPAIPTTVAGGSVFGANFEEMVAAMRHAHGQQSEIVRLREENKQLSAKLALIESAMGIKSSGVSEVDVVTDASVMSKNMTQQPSASNNEIVPKAATQATSGCQAGTGEEFEAGIPVPEPSEKMKDKSGSGHEMQVNDDYVQVGGDDDIDELTTTEPADFTTQRLQEADPTDNQNLGGGTSLPGSDIYPGQFTPQAASLRATRTEQSTSTSTDSVPAAPQPGITLSRDKSLFGVIKPIVVKSSRKGKGKAQVVTLAHTPAPELETPVMSAPKPIDQELVDFSDDENPVSQAKAGPSQQPPFTTPMQLHYGRGRAGPPTAPGVSPWAQQTPVPFAPPLGTVGTSVLGSSSRPGSAGSNSREIHINITRPEDVRRQLEREESGIREPPKEKKTPIQTTEKLLNEELMDLGLEQWIGKEKNTKEYRQTIDRARAEKRDRNKQEALAKAGIVNPAAPPPLISLAPKEKLTGKPGRPPRKHKTLQSLRRTHSRTAKTPKPLADVTNQQNTQTTSRTSRKRKADVAGLDENTGIPAEKPKQRAKRASSRKSQGFWPEPEPTTESLEAGVKTRRQMRQAEIEKLDRLAQKAMENEEAS